MELIFADPKVDFVFKRIFGQESHKDVLIAFLNHLLRLEGEHAIVNLSYLSPEQTPEIFDLKLSIVDVQCTDAKGTIFVVEMQVVRALGFLKRIVFNAAKTYVSQLGQGQDYPTLNDVIAVTICDFTIWPEQSAGNFLVPMLSRHSVVETENKKETLPHIQYVFLELDKYPKDKVPETPAEKWAYFFRETSHLREVPLDFRSTVFEKALQIAKVSNFTKQELINYDRTKMAEQDKRGAIEYAVQQAELKGRQEGLEEGKREGQVAILESFLKKGILTQEQFETEVSAIRKNI